MHACFVIVILIVEHTRIAEILLARPSLQLNLRNLDNKTAVELIQNNYALKILIEKHYRVFKKFILDEKRIIQLIS